MKPTTIIGLDPGSNGGLAISYPNVPEAILCVPTSTTSEGEVLDWIEDAAKSQFVNDWELRVYVEHVTGFIGGANRGSHMFTFGRSYEYIFGICHALKIPLIKVQPAEWQKHFGCPKKLEYKERKKWAVETARARLPDAHRVIADTADAALICSYGRALHSGAV